ncbi:MAG: 4Fe-4S cluster-binding domain-containing protein [Leptospiraceae bacterium]|nr:4Fe-4S cluster-binding domain-containing protein [Leptospiraceae bacterium]
MPIRIAELYGSIQGEGHHSGLRCFFIRTAGCDLRCQWCDSPSALQASSGRLYSIPEIVDQVPPDGPLIQITGGEPLLQIQAVLELIAQLRQERPRSKILLETGGHISLQPLPADIHICMDIKLPSSGEDQHDFRANLPFLKSADEIKFVIADYDDYVVMRQWIRADRLADYCAILASPAWGQLQPASLAEWILRDLLPVRMQVQLHKIIWGNREGI